MSLFVELLVICFSIQRHDDVIMEKRNDRALAVSWVVSGSRSQFSVIVLFLEAKLASSTTICMVFLWINTQGHVTTPFVRSSTMHQTLCAPWRYCSGLTTVRTQRARELRFHRPSTCLRPMTFALFRTMGRRWFELRGLHLSNHDGSLCR